MHAWVAVGVIRVQPSAKLLDGGINLYRRDRIDPISQGDRGVRSGPGSKNQRVVERAPAEYAVDLLVEGLLVLPGSHYLVPDIVHIDKVAIGNGRADDDFIVWGQIRADLEPTNLDERANQDDCYKEHRSFRPEQQQEAARDGEPRQGRQREVG